MFNRFGFALLRAWVPTVAAIALAWALVVPATPIEASDGGFCFGVTPTITDNGPGDLDPRPQYILGTPGPGVILGTDGDDVIDGNGSAFVIGTQRPTGDTICGGGGDDQITSLGNFGGVLGFSGDARIDGGPGNDTITVEAGSVTTIFVDGGPGNDTIIAREGRGMTIVGGEGNDTITATDSIRSVTVDGGLGNDVLTVSASGLSGLNVTGGPGNDVLRIGNAPLGGTIDGGPGNDVIEYAGFSQNLLRIFGGEGSDELRGGAAGNVVLDGGPGNDHISAAAVIGSGLPEYVLLGGDGNDELTSTGSGKHILNGGPGNDHLMGGSADALDGGPMHDVSLGLPDTVFSNCEVIHATP
jgi:Ca2+-binding RTX toxin-like protein